jgi:hypothetical protein
VGFGSVFKKAGKVVHKIAKKSAKLGMGGTNKLTGKLLSKTKVGKKYEPWRQGLGQVGGSLLVGGVAGAAGSAGLGASGTIDKTLHGKSKKAKIHAAKNGKVGITDNVLVKAPEGHGYSVFKTKPKPHEPKKKIEPHWTPGGVAGKPAKQTGPGYQIEDPNLRPDGTYGSSKKKHAAGHPVATTPSVDPAPRKTKRTKHSSHSPLRDFADNVAHEFGERALHSIQAETGLPIYDNSIQADVLPGDVEESAPESAPNNSGALILAGLVGLVAVL